MKKMNVGQMEMVQGGMIVCQLLPEGAQAPFDCILKHFACPPGFFCIL